MRALLAAAALLALAVPARAQDGDGVEPPRKKEWFERHQSPDGGWSPQGFLLQCEDDRCDRPGTWESDAGTTGLVLLAFLGYGETHRTPRYGGLVGRGLRHLVEIQDAEGCIGPRIPARVVTDHAIALLALAEFHALTQSPLHRPSTERGLAFLLSRRNPDGGWPAGDSSPASEVPATTWAVMALRAASDAGFDVPVATFDGALEFLDSITHPSTGLVQRDAGDWSGVELRFTAMAVYARMMCGSGENAAVLTGIEALLEALPERDAVEGGVDPELWYFGTLACSRIGAGPFRRVAPSDFGRTAWREWSAIQKRAVLDSQCTDRDSCRWQSWGPAGGPAAEIGRVGTTALGVLSIEVYYRYPRVFGSKAPPRPLVRRPDRRPSVRARNRAAALDPDYPEPRTGFLR